MQKWEYKIVNKNDYLSFGNNDEDKVLEKVFNSLGSQGWELVTVHGAVVFYFILFNL